jgi:hypothetical protein
MVGCIVIIDHQKVWKSLRTSHHYTLNSHQPGIEITILDLASDRLLVTASMVLEYLPSSRATPLTKPQHSANANLI